MTIKSYFISNYTDGYLMEADYSQLEIRALAELSGDTVLKRDLDSGRDLHTINAANWLSKDYSAVTKEERRAAKTISFQLQYGASYKGIAKRNGISPEAAKRFIDRYEDRYNGVAAWQHHVMTQVKRSRVPSSKHSPAGKPLGMGMYSCPVTKRMYTFYEKESTNGFYAGKVDFYSPEVKNYPVQGFATGDIVPMMVGKLMRQLLRYKGVRLINTVHDSILVDVHGDHTPESIARILKGTLEGVPHYLKEDYGYVANNVFPVDVKWGKNWHDMVDIKV